MTVIGNERRVEERAQLWWLHVSRARTEDRCVTQRCNTELQGDGSVAEEGQLHHVICDAFLLLTLAGELVLVRRQGRGHPTGLGFLFHTALNECMCAD